LNLPRIVRSIARRSNLAEVVIRKVRRSRDRYYTVPSKAGSIEVRMVEDVEDFRPELQTEAFVEHDVLEEREVQAMEAGTRHLSNAAETGRAPARGALCWLTESSWVAKPVKQPVCVGVQSTAAR